MGLFSKGKNNEQSPSGAVTLPDLPEADSNLDLPSINDLGTPMGLPDIEISDLPALPSKESSSANSEDIKSAINEPIKKPLTNASLVPVAEGTQKSKFHLVEASDNEMPVKIGHGEINAHEMSDIKSSNFKTSSTKEIEQIYVRLDKFQTTVKAFEEIKEKIVDIEKLLSKLKEVKEKEEIELEEWENEIRVIKSRIEFVDKNVFDKLD